MVTVSLSRVIVKLRKGEREMRKYIGVCIILFSVTFVNAQTLTNIVTGVYDENTVAPNTVDLSAMVSPDDVATFKSDVLTAFNNDLGGVNGFDNNDVSYKNYFQTIFGDSSNSITFRMSTLMQSVASGTFDPISGTMGLAQTSDSNTNLKIIVKEVFNSAGDILPDQYVNKIGFTILSRNRADTYPIDVKVSATYSDNSIHSVTSNIAMSLGGGDTFFGFTADFGLSIKSILIESFEVGTSTPKNTRIGIDDMGFITAKASKTILVDLNTAAAGGGSSWNEIVAPGSTTALNDSTGGVSGVSITVDNGFQDSTGNTHEGAYNGTVFDEVANDYFFVRPSSGSSTGTVTLTGLDDSKRYVVHLIGANGGNSDRLADYRVGGSFGSGSSPYNGNDFDSYDDGYVSGIIMQWTDVKSSGGILDITVSHVSSSSADAVMLSAIQIMEFPPPPPTGTVIIIN